MQNWQIPYLLERLTHIGPLTIKYPNHFTINGVEFDGSMYATEEGLFQALVFFSAKAVLMKALDDT